MSANASSVPDAAHVISSTSDEEQMQLINDAVRSLPSHAINDLLLIGVCMRCIFRLFGIPLQVSSVSPSVMLDILGDKDSTNASISKESEVEPELCSICLGILQFTYLDNKGMVVKKQSANNLAVLISELVKQEGHQIDSFSLEVSIPPIVQENEQAVWLYVKKKYNSEPWFQSRLSECISTKDALKVAIANPLETLLDLKSGPSSYRFRLTYTQTKPSNMDPDSVEKNGGCKRRKTGTTSNLDAANDKLVSAATERLDFSATEENAVCNGSKGGVENHESSEFHTQKVNEACHLAILCYRTAIYFGGRYLKFSRNVSQTRWIIGDERMGEASVEEIIGGNILPICQGDIYKFHAAGREDIDVRMLGSGRPFLVEIQNARQVPSKNFVKEIETKINNLETKLVGVKNLKMVASDSWALMHEGEAEKQKQYCAAVWISRSLEDEDLQLIASFKDMQILQRTPIRVLHHRSPLKREKVIHWMKIERISGSSQYFLLHLCTQAGTYIKEFVHGDLGRTHPSIGSILGCRAEILQLDVTDVKMDCFLAE